MAADGGRQQARSVGTGQHHRRDALEQPATPSLVVEQYEYGDGPGLQCAREGVVVLIRDFGTKTLWPEYIRLARHSDSAAGLKAALGSRIALKTHFS